MIDIKEKWNAVSHIQKCIRRGYDHNIDQIIKDMYVLDYNYLKYRLSVILSEDIGIANTELINKLLENKLNKKWIDSEGGAEFLISKVKELISSVKDRTACNFGAIADKEMFEYQYGDWKSISIDKSIEIAFDQSLDPRIRSAAVFNVVGTEIFPHSKFQSKEGNWNRWIDENRKNGVAEDVLNSMLLSQKTTKEWHPAFLGLCSLECKESKIALKEPFDFGDVWLYKSCALDHHTSVGKKAIALWYDSYSPLRNGLIELGFKHDLDSTQYLLAKMVFILEGSACNKELTYDLSTRIKEIQKENWSKIAHVNGKKAANLIWSCMPALHNCRTRLMPRLDIQSTLAP